MSKTTSKTKPKTVPETLARQIRAMIEQSSMTTNALAAAVGIPHPVLYRFISGERDNLRLDTADKLCNYFCVKLTTPKRQKGT